MSEKCVRINQSTFLPVKLRQEAFSLRRSGLLKIGYLQENMWVDILGIETIT